MKSLYQTFNCKNKYDLYEKLINKDELVEDLIVFINNQRLEKINKRPNLNNPQITANYLAGLGDIKNTESYIIYLNTQIQVLFYEVLDFNDIDIEKFNNSIKKAIEIGANSCFLYSMNIQNMSNKQYSNVVKLEENLKYINLETMDRFFKISNNVIFSTKMGDSINVSEIKEIGSEPFKKLKFKYTELEDFLIHYCDKKIQNLNYINDLDQIYELLKIGYQNKRQEYALVMTLDKDNNITGLHNIGIGNVKAAFFSPEMFLPHILEDNVKGFVTIHNHPSGHVEQSTEDVNSSIRVSKVAEIVNKKYIDNLIIGREKINSFKYRKIGNINFYNFYNQLNLNKETDKDIQIDFLR